MSDQTASSLAPQDLKGFVEAMGADKALRVEENLGQGFVRLRVAEAERRQAKHDIRCIEDAVIEMLRNARDAGARHIYVASSREGNLRTLVMLDDGQGIPHDLQPRIFEARVTSKLESVHMDRWGIHGRGMALYSVKENVESAEVMQSAPGKGSSIRVVSNAEKLSEKADQSTWPTLARVEGEEQGFSLTGPHNIARTCCEFALEERGNCEVYLGSAAEIAATARARVAPSVEASDLLFLDSLESLPVLERLRAAADASELGREARSLGLDMSERTAHRIIAGQIKPLKSIASRMLRLAEIDPAPLEVDLQKDRRGLKLSRDDAEEFARLMERDFRYLADRYYLELGAAPKLRVSPQKITVTFNLV